MSSILQVRDSATGEWVDIPALIGPKGETGHSGVYFGKDEPTDENVNVWVRDTDNSDNVLNFVSYTPQTLTPEQQAQARENIGACDNIRPRVELSDSIVTLEPNKFYVFPEMASLSVTLGGEADSGAVQEYQFRFISGAVATTLILPEAVKGDITVDANSVVEVSVVDNYAISQSWAVG